jgi:Tfp pilus assembly PilM family ATPase
MPLTDLRSFKIPPASPSDRRAMIQNELATLFHEEEADREFDYWDTDDPSESSQIQIDNVNVVSIKSQALEQVIACVSAAGRRCEVVDGLPLALARALELSGEDSPQTPVGIVDWGYSGATVCAVRGGRPLFTRYLRDCGYSLLLSAVANALGLTLAEAQEVLSVYGLPAADEPSDVQDAILEIAGSHLQHLAGQLIKTSAYLRVQRPPLLPTRYWLLGGGATIRNIDAFLSPRLGVPCAVWQLAGSLGPHPVQMFGPALALSALRWT